MSCITVRTRMTINPRILTMFEGWREAARKVGRWFRRVEEGAEVFMRKWHKDEKEATAERHRTVATATLTGGASTRAWDESCLLYTSPSPRDS